jgi:Acetyltransferases
MTFIVKPVTSECQSEVNALLKREWDCPPCISRGRAIDTRTLPGFVALIDDVLAGVITYNMLDGECEIMTLNSLVENIGIGTALINAVKEAAIEAHCTRLWLITTNDDTEAIRFYQIKGFDLVAVHMNAMALSRKMKPSIPMTGNHGIPIKHEFEFEMNICSNPNSQK